MTCEEVKIILHDYVDEVIDDFSKSEIENHLRRCDSCFKEYKRLNKYFEKLRDLPFCFEAPTDIVSSFRNEMIRQSEKVTGGLNNKTSEASKKVKKEVDREIKKKVNTILKKKSRISKSIFLARIIKSPGRKRSLDVKSTILILIPIIIIALGYFIYDYSKYNSPWLLKNLSGRIYINGVQNMNGLFSQGESLQTDANSKVILDIPKVGLLEVYPITYLLLTKAKSDDNRIQLRNGKVRMVNSETMPELAIQVGDVILQDRSGIFTAEVGDLNYATVKVEYGFLEIEYLDKTYYIDENYICEIHPGFKPGTPYRFDASPQLKRAITKFDYENGGDEAIKEIINNCREEDVLTLLSLMPHTTAIPRQQIYQAISINFPLPSNVTISGVLNAEEKMLYLFWEDIEWQL